MSQAAPMTPEGAIELLSGLAKQVRLAASHTDIALLAAKYRAREADLRGVILVIERLQDAASAALDHVRELREAWMAGDIRETDGKGGLRSNRNVDVESELAKALQGSEVPA